MKRRDFLKAAAIGAVTPHVIPRGVLAAPGRPGTNDRIRTAVIGAGNRVRALILQSPADLKLVAISDCWLQKAPALAQAAAKSNPRMCPDAAKVASYQDYRKMLAKEKLDAVFVTTTTHARVLCCIHSVQAGLDVYAEKPLTLTIEEGRVLTSAVRKHRSVLQAGTQCRSMANMLWAYAFVRNGGLGKVSKVLAPCYMPPERWAPKPGQPVPRGFNWDMWCNQTELRPFHPDLLDWMRWRDYDGGGLSWGMTGWGTHGMAQIQGALGMDATGPVEVWPEKPGERNSPVTMRYANGVILELKIPIPEVTSGGVGGYFFGEKGKMEIDRNRVASNPKELIAGCPPPLPRPDGTDWADAHIRNWIDCMRSRQRPNADVEISHRATTVCHLANIARELGHKLRWDPDKEEFLGDDEANRLRSRPRRRGYEFPSVL
jgi:predicted dehydrogenase